MHADPEHVLAGDEQLRHVELGREAAAGRPARLDAVDPERREPLDPVGAQQHALGVRERRRELERAPVLAGRVRVGHVRRVDGERVLQVRVRGRPVAVQHPVRRDGQRGPAGRVERGVVERRIRDLGCAAGGVDRRLRQQAEPPVAVEGVDGRVAREPGARLEPRGGSGGDVVEVGHAGLPCRSVRRGAGRRVLIGRCGAVRVRRAPRARRARPGRRRRSREGAAAGSRRARPP